jgi:hypothetical protein
MKMGLGLSLANQARASGGELPPPLTLLDGLLAYWKLDTDSWLDSSGNDDNTLVVTNGSSSDIIIETGRITNSAYFAANGSFLEKSDFVFPDFWTISFWVSINSTSSTCGNSCFPSFFDFGYNGGTRLILVEQDGNSSNNQGWIYTSNPGPFDIGQFYQWNNDQWYHICITQNTDGLKWYIDNLLHATDEGGSSSARSGIGLVIGSQYGNQEGDFYGSQGDYRICEYGVWDRVLTSAEIARLYNAGAGRTYPFGSPTRSVVRFSETGAFWQRGEPAGCNNVTAPSGWNNAADSIHRYDNSKMQFNSAGNGQTTFTHRYSFPYTADSTSPYNGNGWPSVRFQERFADSSSFRHSIINNGATISTALGGGAGYFNGIDSVLVINDISLSTQDFTLESWIYLTTYGDQNNTIFNQGNYDNTGAFLVLIGSATDDRKLIFYADNWERFRGTTTIPLNTWTNITVTRESNIYYFFIDGVLEGTHSATYDHNQTPFKIGDGYGGVRYFNGYMDEVRITEGIARYTSNFTPESRNSLAPDPHSANVSLLLQMEAATTTPAFDGGTGSMCRITWNNMVIFEQTDGIVTINGSYYYNGTTNPQLWTFEPLPYSYAQAPATIPETYFMYFKIESVNSNLEFEIGFLWD